jgi:hypothetical protein
MNDQITRSRRWPQECACSHNPGHAGAVRQAHGPELSQCARSYTLAVAAFVLAICAAGCQTATPRIINGTAQSPQLHFKVTLPRDEQWQVSPAKQKDTLLFTKSGTAGNIAVHMKNPPRKQFVAIVVNPSELFAGFEKMKVLNQQHRVIAGQQAICQDWTATHDGQEVEVRMCIFMANQRIYDFAAWAPKNQAAAINEAFDKFIQGFAVE